MTLADRIAKFEETNRVAYEIIDAEVAASAAASRRTLPALPNISGSDSSIFRPYIWKMQARPSADRRKCLFPSCVASPLEQKGLSRRSFHSAFVISPFDRRTNSLRGPKSMSPSGLSLRRSIPSRVAQWKTQVSTMPPANRPFTRSRSSFCRRGTPSDNACAYAVRTAAA